MKASIHDAYGAFDGLRVRDVPVPAIGDDAVLVRVHAAGLHVGDCFGVRGAPIFMRFMNGLRKPRLGIPGFDLAGTVEAVGANVTRFRPGDAVFGTSTHTCAEYACADEDTLALKPERLSFTEAAALPTSALAALHAMRDVAKVQSGQTVLINGASGGVGTFAVQIAKSYGATVTGVCSAKNVDMVRAIGADHVVDYTQSDFTHGETRYDVILDNVENRSLRDVRRVLAPRGTLIVNSGTGARGFRLVRRLFAPLILSPFVRQDLRRYLSVPSRADLVALAELVEAGKLVPVIDRTCALGGAAEALASIEAGHTRGKVVVEIT